MAINKVPDSRQEVVPRPLVCDGAPLGAFALEQFDRLAGMSGAELARATKRAQGVLNKLRGTVGLLLASEHPDDVAGAVEIESLFRSDPARAADSTDYGTDGILRWLLGQSDSQLVGFLRANADLRAERQQHFTRQLPALQDEIVQRFDGLVTAGFWPHRASDVIRRGIGSIRVHHVMDPFEAGHLNAQGEFCATSRRMRVQAVGLGAGYFASDSELAKTIAHEDLHAAVDCAELERLTRRQIVGHRWLLEAFVEHSVLAAFHGSPEVLDPSQRGKLKLPAGTYTDERVLTSALCFDGEFVVDSTLLGDAYFAAPGDLRAHALLLSDWRAAYKSAGDIRKRLTGISRRYNRMPDSLRHMAVHEGTKRLRLVLGHVDLPGEDPVPRPDVSVKFSLGGFTSYLDGTPVT